MSAGDKRALARNRREVAEEIHAEPREADRVESDVNVEDIVEETTTPARIRMGWGGPPEVAISSAIDSGMKWNMVVNYTIPTV